jgi:hypothetical protein
MSSSTRPGSSAASSTSAWRSRTRRRRARSCSRTFRRGAPRSPGHNLCGRRPRPRPRPGTACLPPCERVHRLPKPAFKSSCPRPHSPRHALPGPPHSLDHRSRLRYYALDALSTLIRLPALDAVVTHHVPSSSVPHPGHLPVESSPRSLLGPSSPPSSHAPAPIHPLPVKDIAPQALPFVALARRRHSVARHFCSLRDSHTCISCILPF